VKLVMKRDVLVSFVSY